STAQGLNNPLVKMPVKRFRTLQELEFKAIASGGTLVIGTMSDPIARNLYKNFPKRIRERGEHCSFIHRGWRRRDGVTKFRHSPKSRRSGPKYTTAWSNPNTRKDCSASTCSASVTRF